MSEEEFNQIKRESIRSQSEVDKNEKRPFSAPVMASNTNPIASVWTKKALERAAANAVVVYYLFFNQNIFFSQKVQLLKEKQEKNQCHVFILYHLVVIVIVTENRSMKDQLRCQLVGF